MLRDVVHNVTDGLMGFDAPTGDGLHVKIGVSPVVSDTPILITGSMDAGKIRARLGLSPLADAAMIAVQFGAARMFCLPVAASTPGTIGQVSKEGTGGGSVTAGGTPANAFSVIVRMTAQGGLNTAAFTVSINGGHSFSDEITVPVSGAYTLEGTGLTLTFAEAEAEEQKPGSFLVDDTYTFQTTAPAMTNGDVLAAVEKLRRFREPVEFVHIVGESSFALCQAVSAAQRELAQVYHKPAFFLLESAPPQVGTDGGLDDWLIQMDTERKAVGNYDIQMAAAWGRLVMLDGAVQEVNLAGVAAGLYAKAAVQTSIGKTRSEAGFGIPKDQLLELLPACVDDAVIEALDTAGYLTFRAYDGLDDFYVYHTRMMSPDGSDYRYAEDTRIKNKIIRETRKEALQFLNDDIDLEDVQGELEARAKFLGVPLERMVERKEISAFQITVPEGQAETILKDETMRVRIRYLSRGYIREIEVDLGRSPASA